MQSMKIVALAFLGFTMLQCGSAKKAYEQGDYYGSVIKAVQKLRKNPDNKKAREALSNSYPAAVETLELEAKNRLLSNAQFKFKDALKNYQLINTMHDEIRRSPGALSVIKNPVFRGAKVQELREKAAEESYALAEQYLNRGSRLDAKEAYFLYQDVNTYVPGYKNVGSRMVEARNVATLKVVVEQIPVPTAYTLSANFFQDKVEEHLSLTAGRNEFVRFYTGRDAQQLDSPDQYLRLAFDDFVVGNTLIEKTITNLSKDSVVVGQVTLDDGTKIDAYNTVEATLTVWKKEVLSEGLFSMQVFDSNSNSVLKHDKFNGSFVWFAEWGNFTGDERALEARHKKICKSREALPPPPQDMFIEFTKPIYSDLTRALDAYYSRF
jgi:hypothetical protein